MKTTGALILFCAWPMASQTPKVQFEVATIKVMTVHGMEDIGRRGGPGTSSPTHYVSTGFTLNVLLGRAFGLIDQDVQVSGPAWLNSDRYAIEATMPAATTGEEFNLMFQNLLIDRFKLVLRHETKVVPVYQLLIGKNGHKLRPSTGDASTEAGAAPKDTPANFPRMPKFAVRGQSIAFGAEADRSVQYMSFRDDEGLRTLMAYLQGFAHRPVIDKTGLKGRYDFDIYLYPNGDGTPASILEAAQAQLGLKLEDTKVPLDTIVVESGTGTPAEN